MTQAKILLIGSLPPPIGGVTVSFKVLVSLLDHHPGISVLNLNELRRCHNRFTLPFALLRTIWKKVGQCDVVTIYCSRESLATLALLALLCARLRGKSMVVRIPGGIDYRIGRWPLRNLRSWVVRHANLLLTETKKLVELLESRDQVRVRWFPTTRPRADEKVVPSDHCHRFVCVSQLRRHKGISELFEAMDGLPDTISVDVYGPNLDNYDVESWKSSGRNIRYCGVLEPDQVQPTIAGYDAFLMPSKAITEGYPGNILEAFNAGLPVISTDAGGLGEMVNSTCGIVVPMGDVESLRQAMLDLHNDPDRYQSLLKGALARSNDFSADEWAQKFVEYCEESLKIGARPRNQSRKLTTSSELGD